MAEFGFLLVMMEPPPALEEEFNAWYDTEHLAERLAVPGFLSAIRYVCISGHPRYLAMYDLETYDVLHSEAYKTVGYDRASPWTKRVTSRVKVLRYAGRQIVPGGAVTKRSARVQVLRFSGLNAERAAELAKAIDKAIDKRAMPRQTRILVHETGELLAFTELGGTLDPALDVTALGPFADVLDLVNLYAPYR
jgi:hypothetical protein